MATLLETTTADGRALFIALDDRAGRTLYCLDGGVTREQKDFDELPRFYRTPRGAKLAAAHLVDEKLIWVTPVA